MSSATASHPSELDLLRLADGELPAREARQARQHLESCWQCRTQLEELHRTIAECVRYRNQILRPNLPSPPVPWFDIHAAFSRMDAATGRVSFPGRAMSSLRRGARWTIPALAAAALALAVYQWREAPSVRAAALLEKSAAAAEARPVKPRRIRIQTRTRQLTRVVGAPASAAAQARPEDELAALFRSAHYSWEDPLSARSFREWRDGLERKSDTVESGAGVHVVRTAAESGELLAASLKLNAGDYRPIESRLEFRNREVVDISELPEEAGTVQSQASIDAAPRRAERPAPAPETPAAPAAPGPAEELRVLAALHGVGADLGDPLEISRTPSSIVVSGVGIPPARQREIRQALRDAPEVQLRFAEPEPAPAVEAAPQSTGAPGGESLRFQQRVERQLGGRGLFEDFSGKVLEASEAATSRAYALRRLAQRFPAADEAGLDAASRATLTGLCRNHATELARAASQLETLAAPIMRSLGGSANAVQQKSAGSRAWQAGAEDVFQSAQRVERLLAAMLDGSHAAAAPDLPTRLLTELAHLRAEAEQYRRSLTREPSGNER